MSSSNQGAKAAVILLSIAFVTGLVAGMSVMSVVWALATR